MANLNAVTTFLLMSSLHRC